MKQTKQISILKSEQYQKQGKYWTTSCINDSESVTSSTIVGLLVKDPRMFLPKKKAFNKMLSQMKKNKPATKATQDGNLFVKTFN
jgi:hypothetical protein